MTLFLHSNSVLTKLTSNRINDWEPGRQISGDRNRSLKFFFVLEIESSIIFSIFFRRSKVENNASEGLF
jgi:hypothetical protein